MKEADKMKGMKFCKNPRCGKFHDTAEVKRILGKESAPFTLGYCSARCYTQDVIVKNSDKEKISNALHAEYQKAYEATKPGQILPQWFNDEQLKWIETVIKNLKAEGVTWIPANSGQLPPASEEASKETFINDVSEKVLVRCNDGVIRFARYVHGILESWKVEGCSGNQKDFVRDFAYIFPPEQK